jgi:hypothetical protein
MDTTAKLQEKLQEFMKLPDWELYPLPKSLYDLYKLPPPQSSLTLGDSLKRSNLHGELYMVRDVAPGGVRSLSLPPMPVAEVSSEVKDQNAYEHQQETLPQTADSIESNETKTQQ